MRVDTLGTVDCGATMTMTLVKMSPLSMLMLMLMEVVVMVLFLMMTNESNRQKMITRLVTAGRTSVCGE